MTTRHGTSGGVHACARTSSSDGMAEKWRIFLAEVDVMMKSEPCSRLPGSRSTKSSVFIMLDVELEKACHVICLPTAYVSGLRMAVMPRYTGPCSSETCGGRLFSAVCAWRM